MTSLIHILSQEVAAMVEWQVMTSMAQNLSHKALVDFFCHNEGSAYKDHINHRELREARDIWGIVDYTVWDFIQPENYMFPQLHAEMGLVNNVLDKFYSFIDDQVEAISPEEALARNSYIIADIALCNAMRELSVWKEMEGPQLEFNRYNRMSVRKELKKRTKMNACWLSYENSKWN